MGYEPIGVALSVAATCRRITDLSCHLESKSSDQERDRAYRLGHLLVGKLDPTLGVLLLFVAASLLTPIGRRLICGTKTHRGGRNEARSCNAERNRQGQRLENDETQCSRYTFRLEVDSSDFAVGRQQVAHLGRSHERRNARHVDHSCTTVADQQQHCDIAT